MLKLNRICLIVFCLLFFTSVQAKEWPAIHRINVDAVEKDLMQHPDKANQHKTHYKTEKSDAELFLSDEDQIVWYSSTPFKLTKIVQLNGAGGQSDPFEKPVEKMVSRKYHNKYIVESGPIKANLSFVTDVGAEIATNYYKYSFKHDAAGSPEIDPHISIHP